MIEKVYKKTNVVEVIGKLNCPLRKPPIQRKEIWKILMDNGVKQDLEEIPQSKVANLLVRSLKFLVNK